MSTQQFEIKIWADAEVTHADPEPEQPENDHEGDEPTTEETEQ